MQDQLLFVQFLHPGIEHTEKSGQGWHLGAHRRKFVFSGGEYVSNPSGPAQRAELVFWGEWECPADLVVTYFNPSSHHPRYLFRPYYVPDACPPMNTDPFVFGNRFLYSNCQQITKNGRTQMSFLQIGSMILFGSCIQGEGFALDTLFVVGDCQEYDPRTAVWKLNVPEIVMDTVIKPLSKPVRCAETTSALRLYEGLTFENRAQCENMFSFVPCRIHGNDFGFARPVIRPEGPLSGCINSSLQRHRSQKPIADMKQMKHLWDEVVKQVLDADTLLGVRLDKPLQRKIVSLAAEAIENGSCSSC